MLMSGILAGYVNFLKNSRAHLLLNVGTAIIASYTIPVFLNIGSSNLIKELYSDKWEIRFFSNFFVLTGFCLIAAYSSGNFLQILTGRVMNQLQQNKLEIEETKKNIEQNLKTLERVDQNVKAIVLNPTQDNITIPESTLKQEASKDETIEILNSIVSDKSPFTRVDDLKQNINIADKEMEKRIEDLKEKNMLKEIVLSDEGEKAIAVTPIGEMVLEHANNENTK